MNATIMKVFPEPRMWGDSYPDMCSVRVVFDSGDFGEYGTKKGNFEQHRNALEDLIGKPSEFGEIKSKEYQGITTHQFKQYPGKPTGGGPGGGGRQFVPAFHQTAEGMAVEQERMDRRTALMQAVALESDLADASFESMLHHADQMYAWLRRTASQPQASTSPADAPRQATPAAARPNGQSAQGVPAKGAAAEIWPGPGQCPTCHAPEGKKHLGKCLQSAREPESESDWRQAAYTDE